jgi:hypothetical protein
MGVGIAWVNVITMVLQPLCSDALLYSGQFVLIWQIYFTSGNPFLSLAVCFLFWQFWQNVFTWHLIFSGNFVLSLGNPFQPAFVFFTAANSLREMWIRPCKIKK